MILAPVGAGKTAITLTAMRDLVDNESIRFLVVAPLRVAASVWPVEAAKWAPSLEVRAAVGTPNQRFAALYDSDADVVVINYDNLQWCADLDLSDFTGVVFDELTRLKNPGGKRFKAMEKIVKAVEIRWGLTGSFTSNGLEDVFGQVKIIDQSLLGRTKGAFMQQHFFQYNRGTHVEWEPMPGALQRVMQTIKPATYLLEPGQYKDTLPPLHTVACMPHPLPTAARTLAACHPSQSFPRPLPPAAAHMHAACCSTHATATAAYCCTHAASTTAPASTAASAAAAATSIDSLKKGKHTFV
jgi:hypothetical protein